ncbi:phosphoglycerate mutase-like protein [Xylariaceae sp. FL0255]|nr:phosphoglycerate mutase-like protein [Xylariaceae sp. FL0255]
MTLKKSVLLTLASLLPLVKTETVLGLYVFSRHGDRTPKVLAPANLTSLGADEVHDSGSWYRSHYVASDSATPIFGLSRDIAALTQIAVTAPVDNVLMNSAYAFLQGLYPPALTATASTLANGSSPEGPLGGYQYIPVNAVSAISGSSGTSENSAWLQGSSGCANAVVSSNNYLVSSEYATVYNQSQSFWTSLFPVINSTFTQAKDNFANAYTIFDYINVATIHNQSIPSGDILTPSVINQLQVYANIHEWNLAYNASDSVRAIQGATLAAQIIEALNATLTGNGTLPVNIQFGAYGSFSSFFGLAGLSTLNPDFEGIVDYGANMAFELVTNATVGNGSSYPTADDVSVRFLFSNRSAALSAPVAYPLFGQSKTLLSWADFTAGMNKFAIGNTASWCQACGNTTGVCASSTSSSGNGSGSGSSSTGGSHLSLADAGVIGAFVTLAVILGVEGLLALILGLRVVKKSTPTAAGASNGASSGVKA